MKTEYREIEVWAVVDADGDYAVGNTEDQAVERFDDEIGGSGGRRFVKLTVKVPLPRAIELTGQVTVEEEAPALAVA